MIILMDMPEKARNNLLISFHAGMEKHVQQR